MNAYLALIAIVVLTCAGLLYAIYRVRACEEQAMRDAEMEERHEAERDL